MKKYTYVLNPLSLEIGQAYIVSKQTPLMPSRNPANVFSAIRQMKQIPNGGGFKVFDVHKGRNKPWYRVAAFDQNAEDIGMGWINSIALFGQKLKAFKERI